MTPESIGIPSNVLVLGKHSGRHAFRERLKALGYELPSDKIEVAFHAFKALADKKKEVFDEDIEAIIADDVIGIPEKYSLVSINVVSGSEAIPTATVQLKRDGQILRDAGFGDGPVDATYKTISKMVGTKSKLLKYSVQAITGGTEAQGEVTVSLEEDGKSVVGR
jgi:2-isopropylmalate synthase